MIIVVGVDDTEQAEQAARRALAEAERWDAELHAVHVLDTPVALGEAFWQVRSLSEEYARARREAVWGRIDPILDESGREVSRIDMEGYPPDALVNHCRSVGADLLVVGTRGRGDLASLVLGSTGHRALHTAPCDVLVVKGPTRAGEPG